MALVPLTVFSNCFDQVNDACLAVQRGDANRAAKIVRSLQNDAKTLRNESQRCYDLLQYYSNTKQLEIETMTTEINDLYKKQLDLEKQKSELETRKEGLQSRRESEEQALNNAQSRYNSAERSRRDAEKEVDKLKKLWWVPVVGQILAIRELVEDYSGQERQARRDMQSYQRRINEAENEISNINHQIRENENWIFARMHNITTLKQERDSLHQELSDAKETSVFLVQAVAFWDDLASLSDSASLKTSRMEKLLSFASKKNQIKILRSNGTKTIVGSFKECWMEIEDMVRNNDVVFAVDDVYLNN